MKCVVVVLLSCLVLSVAQEYTGEPGEASEYELNADDISVLDWFVISLINAEGMAKVKASKYLSEFGSSFTPEINMMLGMLESQICPKESQECDSRENWLFGCNCRKEFRDLGECKNKPCQLFKHFKDNGPASLRKFIDAESLEGSMQSMIDYIVVPVSSALCECPEMIGASARCAKNYNGILFEMLGLDGSMFNNVVDNLDWKSLKTVLDGLTKAGCGVKNGKDCVLEISKMYSLGGRLIDNTFRGDDGCLSLKRVEKEITEFLTGMDTMDLEAESITPIAHRINRVMGLYMNMEWKATCDPSCAAEISDAFYTCCTKHAMETLATKEMKQAYKKLFKNVWRFFSEASPPDLSKAFQRYFKIYDIESFCGDQTDAYRVKNEQCEALEA